MPDIRIHIAQPGDTDLLNATKDLFRDYYDFLHTHGIMLKLTEGGESLWLDSILPALNKTAVLALAINQEEVIGFILGSMKLLPAYLGGGKVGLIQHTYVIESSRRFGVASMLSDSLMDWFRTKQVSSIELQVLTGNTAAEAFWKKQGFWQEWTQMRQPLP